MGIAIILIIVLIIIYSKNSSSGDKNKNLSQPHKADRSSQSGYKSKRRGVVQDAVWMPPNKSVSVVGREIPGGLVYFGTKMYGVDAYSPDEPSLINPNCPVNWSAPADHSVDIGYWPSYAGISHACRATYLNWLIGGRRDPECNVGYVFIFFYGLERRVFVDMEISGSAQIDLAAIVSEVKELVNIYGSSRSFDSYANTFLNAVLLMQLPERYYETEPPSENHGWELPISVRYALGQLVKEGKPIPANWAFAWVMLHPETRLKTPAKRCSKEFKSMFRIRYAEKYGKGMILKPNKTRLKINFRTASSGIGNIDITRIDLPDVGRLKGPVNKLRKIVESCSNSLDPLSRFLGRKSANPDGLGALALLPGELFSQTENPQLDKINNALDTVLGDDQLAVLDASLLIDLWSNSTESLTKKETISFVNLLTKLGFGLEPDPCFGGQSLKLDQKVVIFKLGKSVPSDPSKEYQAATILLHLTALISGADGVVDKSENDFLENYIEKVLNVSREEKIRLRSHLAWLLHNQQGFAGVKKRLDLLSCEQKKVIAAFCVGVAGADGRIDPSEIKALNKIYPLLGLNPDLVYTHIHSMISSTQTSVANSPVTVARLKKSAGGYRIPTEISNDTIQKKGVDLDLTLVRSKLAETAKISVILGTIFEEEETLGTLPDQPESDSSGLLDEAHTKLLKALLKQREWSREEYEVLVKGFGLLPEGASDIINEACYEVCDEPLIEGDDPVLVEIDLAKELLS